MKYLETELNANINKAGEYLMKVNDSYNHHKLAAMSSIIGGVIMLVLAIFLSANFAFKKENWIQSVAIIEEVNNGSKDIIYSYDFNERNYTAKASFFTSIFRVGDTLVIYINPDNPSECYEYISIHFANFVAAISLILLVLSVVELYRYVRFLKNKKLCLENGIKRDVKVGLLKKLSGRVRLNFKNYFYYIIFINFEGKEYKSHQFL